MDLNSLKVDTKKQTDGVWFDHDGETSFLIARMGNPKFKKLFGKLMAPHSKRFNDGKLSQKIQNELMAKAVSSTILLGWKGLTLDGKPIEFSQEKAFEILSDDTSDEFLALIIQYAEDNENYRNSELEETAKNLKAG